jgi:hypothetical protein
VLGYCHNDAPNWLLITKLIAKLLLALASIVILCTESHGAHVRILLSDGCGSLQALISQHTKIKTGGFGGNYSAQVYCILIDTIRPPLWSIGQSSWLQIQRSGFDLWRYQIFWEVVGLKRGPLSLVSTIEELLGRKKFRLRSRKRRIRPWGIRRADFATSLCPQKLTLTSPTSGSHSVGTFRSWTQATEFYLIR